MAYIKRIGSAMLLITITSLVAGCGSSPEGAGKQPALPTSIECHVFYRPSPGQGLSEGPEVVLSTDEGRREKTVTFDDLEFKARYWGDQFEGHSLQISVTDPVTGDEVITQLYQLDREQGLVNQFIGGHGFTGLVYVYHPASPAELQYFCAAR